MANERPLMQRVLAWAQSYTDLKKSIEAALENAPTGSALHQTLTELLEQLKPQGVFFNAKISKPLNTRKSAGATAQDTWLADHVDMLDELEANLRSIQAGFDDLRPEGTTVPAVTEEAPPTRVMVSPTDGEAPPRVRRAAARRTQPAQPTNN